MESKNGIAELIANHKTFVAYINNLSEDEFMFSRNSKWTPGQQLAHVALCIKPLAQVLPAKAVIGQKFGKTDRKTLSYDEIVSTYYLALEKGGKAPERFVPEKIDFSKRNELANGLLSDLESMNQAIGKYAEQELDSLLLPHPLLGNLTIREMLYLMSCHAIHHHEKTKQNLNGNVDV
jgi:hypothetical protein